MSEIMNVEGRVKNNNKLCILSCNHEHTWVKVVRWRRRAGVGHEEVVGVWPACALIEEERELTLPALLPPRDTPGSGFSFLNAPSAPEATKHSFFLELYKIYILI
jgi:hypothetical protein